MRTSSTITGIGCMLTICGLAGCRHSDAEYHPVTPPVGVMTLREDPSGKPGVFVAVDENDPKNTSPSKTTTKPEITASPTTKPLVLPSTPIGQTFTPTAKPAVLPEKVMSKPLPAENIIVPATPVPKPSALGPNPLGKIEDSKAPLFDIKTVSATEIKVPLLNDSAPKKAEVKAPPAVATSTKNTDVIAPVIAPKLNSGVTKNADVIVPAVAPTPVVVAEPVTLKESKDYTKGKIPSFAGNPKYGHADGYEWVVGELCLSEAKKSWRIRYAGLDSDDQYGGSLTLSGADILLEHMVNGQLVRVEGEVLEKNRNTAPRYHVVALKPVD
ncbi:hypothetical protein [Zavarzinella formosa]|uniref:hypothetical protein n=1 Tax=Zavarzinella formosa TaxID=360055 RepID=UPI0003120593|nr:hypothetical protein [Zavarzinella formosa]